MIEDPTTGSVRNWNADRLFLPPERCLIYHGRSPKSGARRWTARSRGSISSSGESGSQEGKAMALLSQWFTGRWARNGRNLFRGEVTVSHPYRGSAAPRMRSCTGGKCTRNACGVIFLEYEYIHIQTHSAFWEMFLPVKYLRVKNNNNNGGGEGSLDSPEAGGFQVRSALRPPRWLLAASRL